MTVRLVILPWRLAPLRVDDQPVLGQELICNLHGALEIASRVVAQVYHQIFKAILRQFSQGYQQLRIGRLTKALDADIARCVIKHISGRNTLLWDFTTCHRKELGLLFSIADDANLHFRVLGPFQPTHGFIICHDFSNKRLAVHAYNLISSQQSRPFGRSVLDDILHVDGVLSDCKLDSHA